jgi:hypothetical protein
MTPNHTIIQAQNDGHPIEGHTEAADLLALGEAMAGEMRRIAEGNLGDAPWQAHYDKIRAVAAAALEAWKRATS